MPTDQNAYNARVTDEALEKRFRDTFRSQGGAELVDDLYASGVIVPVVDFTAAAEGSSLRSDLQTAWDSSTGLSSVSNTLSTLVSTPGFWQVDLTLAALSTAGAAVNGALQVFDGTTTTLIWRYQNAISGSAGSAASLEDKFVVFLRTGDSLRASTSAASVVLNVWYRQIADVSGNLINPSGFTSS